MDNLKSIHQKIYQHNLQYYSSYASISFLEELVSCRILIFESLYDSFLLKKDIIQYENIKDKNMRWETDVLSRKNLFIDEKKVKALQFSNEDDLSSFLTSFLSQ